MKLKVNIPDSLDDITIGQFQQIDAISKRDLTGEQIDDEILKLFTGAENPGDISQVDRDSVLASIGEALTQEGEFQNRFTLNGIEFGMIPNFDKITGSEYTDLLKYADKPEHLHRLIAVAFRPIKLKDTFKNYQITNYNGTGELCEIMKDTPMSIVRGFNVFFLSLS